MSVLLNALKKAAEEKKLREAGLQGAKLGFERQKDEKVQHESKMPLEHSAKDTGLRLSILDDSLQDDFVETTETQPTQEQPAQEQHQIPLSSSSELPSSKDTPPSETTPDEHLDKPALVFNLSAIEGLEQQPYQSPLNQNEALVTDVEPEKKTTDNLVDSAEKPVKAAALIKDAQLKMEPEQEADWSDQGDVKPHLLEQAEPLKVNNPANKDAIFLKNQASAAFLGSQKVSAAEKTTAKNINSLLFKEHAVTAKKTKTSASSRRLGSYSLVVLIVFSALSYYGFTSFKKLQLEHEQDINDLLNIVQQAELELLESAAAIEYLSKSSSLSEAELSHESHTTTLVQPLSHALEELQFVANPTPEVTEVAIENIRPTQRLTQSGQAQVLPRAEVAPRPARSNPVIHVEKAETKSFAELAHNAFVDGDILLAQQHYQRHLQDFPHSKTARLGLAAISVRLGNIAQAINYYQLVLRADPNDLDALAGMAAIASDLDSRYVSLHDLQQLIRRYPHSSALNFALGNQYAQARDWFLAQPAYFEAVKLSPQNADYRLNLAISLDQLGEYAQAVIQYKFALALVDSHKPSFDLSSVNQRVMDLERFLESR
ncbi:tetratricopeptide repeat protein [Thiomicrospira sp. R3]|uniref:tetratricopeptide repeat protein n=1 Tax=Thiomicrospira sp. R3 TaxID=3035472 RepID=UPI00259B711C|nr:tetratricopeptide repeat protein [Thiomicrospira sp. R3]WFE68681.1 tetratricopeptide repeat protein [Thiomicrospira sp. R3]